MEIKGLKKIGTIQKIIYFVLLMIVIIAVLGWFVIKPSAEDIKSIREDIKEQRIELERKYLEGLNARLVSQKADEIKGNLEVLDGIFIKKEGYLSLVTSIERLAGENNLQEELNILNNNAEDKRTYKVVPVHIEAKGEFNDLLAFVHDLKNTSYQFNINSLRIRSENPDPMAVLRQRAPKETEKVTTTTAEVIEMDSGATTTTTTKEEILIQKTPTSSTPTKEVSALILGEVYWEK